MRRMAKPCGYIALLATPINERHSDRGGRLSLAFIQVASNGLYLRGPAASVQPRSGRPRETVPLFANLAVAQGELLTHPDLRSRRQLLPVRSTGTTTGKGIPFMRGSTGTGLRQTASKKPGMS
jgi:hypothetical protein